MTPFVSRFNKQSWIMPVAGMSLVLGFMISMAWVTKTNRLSRQSFLPLDQRERVNENLVDPDAFNRLSSEVANLRETNHRLETALSTHDGASKALDQSLKELQLVAGMTPVIGPGVMVTLMDSPKYTAVGADNTLGPSVSPDLIIHDVDALKVANELFAAGAEAVSVNNIRIANNSSLRCVGNTILVNDVKIASPVKIRAIGDPNTLMGAMNMPGGVLAEIRQTDPRMVQIEAVKTQELPEFVGNTARKFAKVPPASEAKQKGTP